MYTNYKLFRVSLLSACLAAAGVAHAQAPTITAATPAANARAAARAGAVQVTFSQPLTAASASALKVFGSQRGGLRTRGATLATVSGSTLAFSPVAYAFAPGEAVSYIVTTAAAGSGGTLARPRVSEFTAAVGGTGVGVFGGGSSVAVPTYASKVLAGDVDGDGDLDLVALNYNTGGSNGKISVRLNGGDATGSNTGVFSGTQDVMVGLTPSDVALGDVDGDGDLDMLVVNYATGTASVRLNNGSGLFGGTGSVALGTNTNSLTLGDIDGDGDLDLLATNSNIAAGASVVQVRLNNGSGTFSGTQTVSVEDLASTVRLADVDNDGDLDLLTANYSAYTVSVRLNGGNGLGTNTGVFSGGSSVAVGSRPGGLALGDVDGDGDVDLLTANLEGTTATLRLNAGNGTFGGGQTITVGNNPRGVVLGDVDADGDLDLLVPNVDDNTVSVRLNGGDATGSGTGVFAGGGEFGGGDSPVGLALADVDGDGDLDALVGNYTYVGAVTVRLNRPTGPPTISSFSPVRGPVGTSVTLTGTGLLGATSVGFGGQAQPVLSGNSATSVTTLVPTGAITGPVTVTTPGGTATSSALFEVVPVLSAASPASAPAGAAITLSGTGLGGATAITFAGSSANVVSSGFTVNATGTQITGIVVPGGAATGNVTVTTAGGTSNGVGFTVTVLVPQLTSLSPASAPAGATIALVGTGLTNATVVTFAGTATNTVTTGFSVPAASNIIGVVVPSGAITGSVTVTTPGGTSNALPFTVTNDLIITGTTPRSYAPAGSRTAPLQVAFNQPLLPAAASGLRVFGGLRGGLRTRNTAATVSGNQLVFTPAPAFSPGEVVSYTVSRTVSSSLSLLNRSRVGTFVAAAGGTGRGRFTGNQFVQATNSLPASVVLGDVDGDGDLDALYGGVASGTTVGLALNGADASGSNTGIFGLHNSISTNSAPEIVRLADVDGDGDLDVLAACLFGTSFGSGSTVSVRLNGGNATGSNTGTFSAGSDVPVGDGPRGLAVGDIDGDGDLDFVTANTGLGLSYGTGGTVSVRLNNGNGTYSLGQTVYAGLGARDVALADLDGDGDLDLLVANVTANTVSVRLNGGDASGSNTGTFAGTTELPVGTSPSSIAVGDVDGDGDVDMAVANRTQPGTVSVRLNGGLGYFIGGSEVNVYSDPAQVILGDVDADGDLDLLTADYQGQGGSTVSVRLNGGDASGSNTGTFSGGSNPPVGSNSSSAPSALALGDLDGDGDLDLVTANAGDGTIGVRFNRSLTEPTITSFSPQAGVVGTSITITGTFLSGATVVSFNGAPQTVITSNTATGLTVQVPPGATTGPITITNPLGLAVSTMPFTVNPTPVLTSISPASGPVGSTITLIGTGLRYVYGVQFAGTSNNTVFNGLTVNAAGTEVTGVVVPSGATTGTLTAIAALANSNGLLFTVTPRQLTVTQGTTTYPNNSTYYFGSQPIGSSLTVTFVLNNSGTTPISLSNFSLTGDYSVAGGPPAVVPAGGSLALPIVFAPAAANNRNGVLTFTSPEGSYSLNLTGLATYLVPTISSLAPASGAPGTTVTVTGTGFVAGSTTLTLNGQAISPVVSSSTALTFVVPGNATAGPVAVSTPGGSATSAATFCVQYQPYPVGGSRCGAGSLTLSVSGAPGAGSYAWYSSSSGGTPLATAATFTTGLLAATTTYYVGIRTGAAATGCEGSRVPVMATIDPLPVVGVAASGPLAFCPGGSVTLTASGADSYLWSTGQTSASISVVASGTYSVSGRTQAGCGGTPVATTVTLLAAPAQPVVTAGAGGQLSSSSATGNQWYLNGVAIAGATGQAYLPASNGSYTVVVTSAGGCVSAASAVYAVTQLAALPAALASQLQVFPNPASQVCTVQLPALPGGGGTVVLLNALGAVVRQLPAPATGALTLELRGLARGLYVVQLRTSLGTCARQLAVE